MTSMAEPPPALSAKGGSVSWKGQHTNVGRIFNEFAEQDEELDADWDNLPEDVLAQHPWIWLFFGTASKRRPSIQSLL